MCNKKDIDNKIGIKIIKLKLLLFLYSHHPEPSFHLVYIYEEFGSKHSLHFF